MTELVLDNEFWRFSVAVYSAFDVAEECLVLQDTHHADINILLFCGWLACSRKVDLKLKDIEAIDATVRSWRDGLVKPLRSMRRFLKGMPSEEIRKLRDRVKACEIDAEQIEQAMLHAYAKREFARDGNSPFPSVISSNLEAYLNALGYRRENPDDVPLKHLHRAMLALSATSTGH